MATPAAWVALSDDEWRRLFRLPLRDFCFSLLDMAPKASAADVREVAIDAELANEDTPKVTFRTIRDEWRSARAGAPARVEEENHDRLDVRERVLELLIDAAKIRDRDGILKYTESLKKLDGVSTSKKRAETEDFSRLSDSEFQCLAALTRKLNGEPIGSDGQAWIARVSEHEPVDDPDGELSDPKAPGLAAIDREAVKRSGFVEFVRIALPHVTGVGRVLWGWHLEEIARHAEALYRGQEISPGVPFTELIVNIPPGHIKSTIVSVLLSPWIWTENPSYEFMHATFDDSLSTRFASFTRDLLTCDWFVERWGHVLAAEAASNGLHEMWTVANGYRFATTCPGGRGTGRHCHMFILDDPIKPSAVKNKKEIGAVLDKTDAWISTNVLTRGKPGYNMRVAICMQRVHEEDTSGKMVDLKLGTTVHLCFPFKYEPERHCATPFGGDRRKVSGQELWPAACKTRDAERAAMKDGGWAGSVMRSHWQQDPTGGSDQIFKPEAFQDFSTAPAFGETLSCLSVDPTFGGRQRKKAKLDFVAIEVWGYLSGHFYCYYSEEVKRGFRETVAAILRVLDLFPATHILVEAAANGDAIVDQLDTILPNVIPVTPNGDKESRAQAASHAFNAKRVHFDKEAVWYEAKARTLARFPAGAHDDTVDTTSQAILWLGTQYGFSVALEQALDEWIEERKKLTTCEICQRGSGEHERGCPSHTGAPLLAPLRAQPTAMLS